MADSFLLKSSVSGAKLALTVSFANSIIQKNLNLNTGSCFSITMA